MRSRSRTVRRPSRRSPVTVPASSRRLVIGRSASAAFSSPDGRMVRSTPACASAQAAPVVPATATRQGMAFRSRRAARVPRQLRFRREHRGAAGDIQPQPIRRIGRRHRRDSARTRRRACPARLRRPPDRHRRESASGRQRAHRSASGPGAAPVPRHAPPPRPDAVRRGWPRW